MVYALMREFVGQLEASLSRRLQRGVLKRRINKPKLDANVASNALKSMKIHRGPSLPPLIVTSRTTMTQTLRQTSKAAAEEAEATATATTTESSANKRRTFLRPLFKSIGFNVSNCSIIPSSFLKDKVYGASNSFIKTETGVSGLSRFDGSSSSSSQE